MGALGAGDLMLTMTLRFAALLGLAIDAMARDWRFDAADEMAFYLRRRHDAAPPHRK